MVNMGDFMKILVINPGSTSTKIAVYNDEMQVLEESLRHDVEVLSKFKDIFSQLDFRAGIISDFLSKNNLALSEFDAIAARGGTLPPAEGGTYKVDESLLDATKNHYVAEHPSLLGALIADSLSKEAGIPAFITDPVSVDEWHELSRFSGLPELPRISLSHALNLRAVARRMSSDIGKPYNELNLIIIHLGGGISVAAHKKGRQIDANNANEDGPFSPERTGSLPVASVVKECFSGKYDFSEMKKRITKTGGLVAYLGTNDVRKVISLIESGDKKAETILDAMLYQVAKETGRMAAVLHGKVDAIAISGGIAHNKILTDKLSEWIDFIAPVHVYPGEDEMLALAQGAIRVMKGEESAKIFKGGKI